MSTAVSAGAVSGTAAADAILSARNLTKTYGSTHALRGVNFAIHRGKVTTLFGENGAGKSTLMKILSGVVTPTSGEIDLDGRRVSFKSTVEARDHGISIIHQELSLAPNLSVRDNVFLGRELRRPSGIDFAEEARHKISEEIDPMTPVEALRLGQQQLVEIARALSVDSLDVRAGEIVCIYGLMGAGRTELLEAIAGQVPMVAGQVLLEGEPVGHLGIAGRIAKGLVLVPEDRQRDGLVQTMCVGENLSLASIGAFVKRMLTSRPRERALVDQSIRTVHIKTAGGATAIGSTDLRVRRRRSSRENWPTPCFSQSPPSPRRRWTRRIRSLKPARQAPRRRSSCSTAFSSPGRTPGACISGSNGKRAVLTGCPPSPGAGVPRPQLSWTAASACRGNNRPDGRGEGLDVMFDRDGLRGHATALICC